MLWLWLLACVREVPQPFNDACSAEPPTSGFIVEELRCAERRIDGGEGELVDLYLASPTLRMVVRHPQAARSLAGLGGGTVLDIATWTGSDVAYEWAPLVGGGWMDVDSVALEVDGAVVTGRVRSLPDLRVDEGAQRTVRYRLDPDAPQLHIEGADGLWMHPLPGAQRIGSAFVGSTQVVTDADSVDDLGGAVRLAGARTIAVAPLGASEWLNTPTTLISGVAVGADALQLDTPEGWLTLPIDDDTFFWELPRSVSRVRAVADGFAASAWQLPGQPLVLQIGPPGRLVVAVPDTTIPASVVWQHADGRRGRALTQGGVAHIAPGAGDVRVTVSAGPATMPTHHSVSVSTGRTQRIEVPLLRTFDTTHSVAALLRQPSERDRTTRAFNEELALDAAHSGYSMTVFAPSDDVAQANELAHVRSGATLTSPDGWWLSSWTWSAHRRRAAHGAPAVVHRAVDDAVALAYQGAVGQRYVVASAEWMRQASIDGAPLPDAVWLQTLDDVDAWLSWARRGVRLLPVGPITWVGAVSPKDVMAIEVERAIEARNTVASNEGRIALTLGGAGPGATAHLLGPTRGTATIYTGGALTDAELWVDGELRDAWPVVSGEPHRIHVSLDAGWLTVLATGQHDFALSAPIELGPSRRVEASR